MIYIKSEEEIKVIREGGKILNGILEKVSSLAKPGVSAIELEKVAVSEIKKAGGRPAFKNYPLGDGIFFPTALCVSLNEEIIHGSADKDKVFKSGDIVDIDVGMEWPINESIREDNNFPTNKHSELGGFYTDMCKTVGVGVISKENKKLLNITRDCLYKGISKVKDGARLNDIAQVIEDLAESHDFGVVRDFVGHGVGYKAHEAPDIFHYTIKDNSPENIELKEGMIICIEPMINLGTWQIDFLDNEYTVVTKDGLPSAHFEHTILVTKDGYKILTDK
ncbi:MAG: type I methionyl aminopeptidase [Patescibacteria group bacterium]|jgi:methionyl aminopeptidase|nr:type I methionyl aminopeptidase [Patescibacteria group bacterium]